MNGTTGAGAARAVLRRPAAAVTAPRRPVTAARRHYDALSLRDAPLIICTDIGGDPDDALALTCAARGLPQLALVLTADENAGQRARFARHVLDLHGCHHVPVVAGADLGNTRWYCVDGLIPADIPAQPVDLVSAVQAVCAGTDGPVLWAGLGPVTNLDQVLTAVPDLAQQLVITQMGGTVANPESTRAEHNLRLDPDAARRVLDHAHHLTHPLTLVTTDVTATPDTRITADHQLYRRLSDPHAPRWARILGSHLDGWYTGHHDGTHPHDPLTLTAAAGLPFVRCEPRTVTITADGHLREDPAGGPVRLSIGADYPSFNRWLDDHLSPAARP